MGADERQRGRELVAAVREGKAKGVGDGLRYRERREQEIGCCKQSAENILSGHHLGAGVRFVPRGGEDVVLGGVSEAVEEEVDGEQEEAPAVCRLCRAFRGGGFARVVQGEEGDAGGDEGHDGIFVERVAFAEDGEVQEHDGQELARLREDEGDVVDVGEAGVAEGRGEGGGDGDEDQGAEDRAGGEDEAGGGGARRGAEEVDVACQGGESGLHRVEENGVREALRGRGWPVGRGCYAFLEESPR